MSFPLRKKVSCMMKAAKQQRRAVGTGSHTRTDRNTSIYCNRDKTPRKGSAGRKTSGESVSSLISSLSPPTTLALSRQSSIEQTSLLKTQGNASIIEQPGQKVSPFTKIKVQLFPIDEATQKALEKEGYNPHLELSVSNRKKISSVLKHLKSKWGTSSIAQGDLMLFPYNVKIENVAACRRWTLDDTDTSADVYAAVGSPRIFRLRYGWFSSPVSNTFCIPLATSQHGHRPYLGNNFTAESRDAEKQRCKTMGQENKPMYSSFLSSSAQDKPLPLDRAAESQGNSNNGNGLSSSSSLWADGLTNISIGGLLSEPSLQAAANRGDSQPAVSNLGLQQTPFSCDSFDAAIAAYLHGRSHGPQNLPRTSHSILDAEETCHAFSYQKLLSSSKEMPFLSISAASGSCSQDANSKSFKFPNSIKVNSQALMQDHIVHDRKADPLHNLQAEDNNIARSFGMGNISCEFSQQRQQ